MSQKVLVLGRRGCQVTALLLAFGLGLASPAATQTDRGTISGTISDTQGGVLPGVTVTLRNAESGVIRTSVSESDGRYRFVALPPARYNLTAELAGFATVEVPGFTLTIGLDVRRDLTMGIQALQESLTVTGEAPVVETTRVGVAAVVTQQQIEALPVASRSPVVLALLLPGTNQDTSQGRRTTVQIGGAVSAQGDQGYAVDGAMNWSSFGGEPRLEFPQAAIQEFRVSVTQAPADTAGATGGVVSVVTRSGGNRYSGEIFEFFRDKSLNALNMFEKQNHDQLGAPKPEFRRHQFGAAFGGPIVRNRLHFFVTAERTDEKEPFTVRTGQPQFYSALEGSFSPPRVTNLYFWRGDLQLNSKQSLFVRHGYMGELNECDGCGGTNAAFSLSSGWRPRDSLVVGHTWVLSSRMVNEFRAHGAFVGYITNTYAPGGTPWSKIGKVGEFPAERTKDTTAIYIFPSLRWGSDDARFQQTATREIKDDFSITAGKHNLKAGGVYLSLPTREDVPGNPRGTWTLGSDQFFDGTPASIAKLTNPIQFQASFPPLVRELTLHWIQAYIQDEWQPRSNLTLNLGLRYDVEHNSFNQDLDLSLFPRPLPFIDPPSRGDRNNFAPRLGAAWNVNGDGRTLVKGGYGIAYQLFSQGPFRNEIVTLRQTSIVIRNPTYPDPYGGRTPESYASTAPPNINIVGNDIENSGVHVFNLGLSRELGSQLALHLDGIYKKDFARTSAANINTPDPVTLRRPLPEWGRIIQANSTQTAKYRGLYVRLDKRYARRHQYLVSYTLSKLDTDSSAGTSTTITDFYNPGLDWGPADADRRHALVTSGSLLLPFDVTVGAVWTLRSSRPFSARAGIDLNQDGSNTDYVPGTTKNNGNRDTGRMLELVNAWRAANGRGPIPADQIDTNPYNRLDVRFSKSLSLGGQRRLELIGQVFNVLGSDNLPSVGGGWVTNALSGSFGRILDALPRQQAELALRIVF